MQRACGGGSMFLFIEGKKKEWSWSTDAESLLP